MNQSTGKAVRKPEIFLPEGLTMAQKPDSHITKALKVVYAPQLFVFDGIASLLKRNPAGDEKEMRAFQMQMHRDEAKAALAKTMASVQQEMAIASRIATADEVEIEEYYEAGGKGSAGLSMDEKGAALGIGGEARKVTKRIIRFKGWRDDLELPDTITQISGDKAIT